VFGLVGGVGRGRDWGERGKRMNREWTRMDANGGWWRTNSVIDRVVSGADDG
jgi:hypothetical protein